MNSLPSALLLAIAIALEVTGTLCLRASDGFTRSLPAIGVLLGYGVSLVFFARALSGGLGGVVVQDGGMTTLRLSDGMRRGLPTVAAFAGIGVSVVLVGSLLLHLGG